MCRALLGARTGWGIYKYRANPNYLWNPKFCVGCFEFYLSKILRQHLKQGGKNLRFFSAEPIFAERIETKVFLLLRFFLRNPFLRRAWGTLDSGIAVQSYTGIQMLIIWTVGLQSNPTRVYKCGSVELWDCSP